MEDQELRKLAKSRVDFKRSILAYVVVIPMLAVINMLTAPEYLWFLFPAVCWGIGLIIHALVAYGPWHGTGSVDREYEKLKKKQEIDQSR